MDNRTRLTIASYDRGAEAFADANPQFIYHREFVLLHSMVKGKRVLEIGSGGGRDARIFLQKKYDYLGVDASRGLLRVAKRHAPHGTFRYMNFYDLRFPKCSFDAIWCIATMLHVPKRRLPKVLRSMTRILKQDGVAVFAVKQKQHVGEILLTQKRYGGVTRFFSFFTKQEFARFLTNAGLRVVKTFVQKENENVWLSFVCKVR